MQNSQRNPPMTNTYSLVGWQEPIAISYLLCCLMDLLTTFQIPWPYCQPCKCCCDGPYHKDRSSGNDHCHLGVWPVPAWQLHAQWLAQCSCSCLNACNQGPGTALVIFFSHLTCYYRSSLWVSTLKHSKHFNSNLESSTPSVSPFIAM